MRLRVMSVQSEEGLAPGPSSKEVPGVLADLRAFAPDAHRRLFQRYGDVVRLQAGPFVTHFLFHPDDVKHVVQDAQRNYSKLTYGGRRAIAILGNGLLMSEGQAWVRQRKLTQAASYSRPNVIAGSGAKSIRVLQAPHTSSSSVSVTVKTTSSPHHAQSS